MNERSRSFAAISIATNKDIKAAVESSDLNALLRSKLRKLTVDNQTYYLAEGDTLLDEDQLGVYALTKQKEAEAHKAIATASAAGFGTERLGLQARGLIAMTQGGKIVRWEPNTVLSYRVVRNTFGGKKQNYDLVVTCMHDATKAWEDTCGVRFQHMEELDERDGVKPEGAWFAVRELDAGGEFIAAAFFPNDPVDRRRVVIDPSFYSANLRFDKVGVLRHELGHVLGFRHELIRSGAPAVCPKEPLWDARPLTDYDPQSVMHYFCDGVGSSSLRITELDRVGAQQVYGPSLNNIHFAAA
jgi:hypothetical protein